MVYQDDLEYVDPTPIDASGNIYFAITKGGLNIAFKKNEENGALDVIETAPHPGILKYKLKKRGIKILTKSLGQSLCIDLTPYTKLYNTSAFWVFDNNKSWLYIQTPNNSYKLPVGEQLHKNMELSEELAFLYELAEVYHQYAQK